MKIILAFWILASILGVVYSIIMIYKSTKMLKRCDNLYEYRVNTFLKNKKHYYKLPSYKEMLYSDKPFEDKYWIDATQK